MEQEAMTEAERRAASRTRVTGEELDLSDGERQERASEQSGERVEAAFGELGRALELEAGAMASAKGPRARRSDAGQVRLTARDISALTWVGEQYAIFQPQLERLLACSRPRTYVVRSRWTTAGWAAVRSIRADQPPLVWLTAEGLRMCELDFPGWRPSAGMLAHVYAVNEVRLRLAEMRPEWGWTCERELARRQERTAAGVRVGHRPDALVETDDGRTIPVEVELTQKKATRIEAVMREAVKAHGQVWYFAPPGLGRSIEKVAERLGLGERVNVDGLPEEALSTR